MLFLLGLVLMMFLGAKYLSELVEMLLKKDFISFALVLVMFLIVLHSLYIMIYK